MFAKDVNDDGNAAEVVEEKKMEYRKSLWQGNHKEIEDFKTVEDAKLWTDAEIDFTTNRINDCYAELLIVLFEDFPMCAMNAYLIVSLGIVNAWIFGSFTISCISIGIRLSEFFKIVMYKRQLEFVEKQIENTQEFESLKEKLEKKKASLISKGVKFSVFGKKSVGLIEVKGAAMSDKYGI